MAAPTVTSVTPATGPASGGTTVLIVGTGFTGVTAVKFGTASADFEVSSSTLLAATAPAYFAGAATVTVTNADGTSTDAVTYTYTGTGAMFTVAEAREFDGNRLGNSSVFLAATITSKEAAIRSRFERIIGVALTPTSATETHDGDGTSTLYLRHHNPYAESVPRAVAVTALTLIAPDGTELAFTADQLTALVCYPDKIVWRYGIFIGGYQNIRVTYTHGYTTCPDDIKQAALTALTLAPPDGIVPSPVSSFATGGTDGPVNWARVKDESRGRYYGNELIDSVLREHRNLETLPGIA